MAARDGHSSGAKFEKSTPNESRSIELNQLLDGGGGHDDDEEEEEDDAAADDDDDDEKKI